MTDTLFLGRRAERLLDAPDLKLKSPTLITEPVDLSSYYAQPVYEGFRVLEDKFEVIHTGKKSYIYDVLSPGPFAMRMSQAYGSKTVKKYSVAPSTLVGSNNPTAIVWDYLESGCSGVYFRSAYGSYHNSNLFYVSELAQGEMTVFSISGNLITGNIDNTFVTVPTFENYHSVGSTVNLFWINNGGGNPHSPIVAPARPTRASR